jgi:signal transduction histidine kinase/ActR/RegA family two-component response regulator
MKLLQPWLRDGRPGAFGWAAKPLQREQLLALCFLMVFSGSMLFYLLPQQLYDPRANLWASLSLLALLPLIWVQRLQMFIANLAVVIFVSLLTYIAVKTGGINSPVMVYLIVVAVPTLFFFGVWGAAFWMLLVLSIQVGLMLATLRGGLIQNMETQDTVLWSTLNHLMACSMLMWMLSLFERSHRSQLAVVKARNLELEAASAQLLAAQSHKDEFVAAVGHELRTPMNAILGLNGLLREELADNPSHVDTVDHIRLSTEHLLSVVNDILDFAQLQAGRVQLFPEPIAVQAWLAVLLPKFSARAQAKGLDWQVQVSPQLPAEILLDRQRLSQLLEHLLDNAIKFTAQGRITLRLQRQDGCLRVEVQDTGRGVAPERHTHIFNRFESADVATHQAFGGTGLGLSICERLVVLQGGRIGVRSEVGRGALFWFELPLQTSTVLPVALAAPAPWSGQAPFDVLVVDDNAMNLMVAQLQLRKAWPMARITTAASGAEALAKIQAQPLDLALIDMVMPEMDGLAVTRTVRQLPQPLCHLPVIALTANANPVDRQRCLDAGMNDVLYKPMDPERMLDTVSQVMAARQVLT